MKKAKCGLRTVLWAALILAVAAVLCTAVYTKYMLGKIEREDSTLSSQTAQPEDTDLAPIRVDKENIINIMLVGQDRRPNEGRQRSDVMLLCTVNKSRKKLTLTSFQRDMYVTVPGYTDTRMNAAYQLGGMALLKATLEKNFGLTVDGIVEVDFAGFANIVEILGGVEITLTPEEAEQVGISPGKHVLNGKQALTYARIRQIDSDFHRTNRQRTVVTSLLEQNRDIPLNRMHELLNTCLVMVATDMTDAQILQYASEIFPLLKDLTIESGSIPSAQSHVSTYIAGHYVLIPDLEEARERLQAIMDTDS